MVIPESPCGFPNTYTDKAWPYVQYYTGERDTEQRKNGQGRNCWSGAKSLEWYSGYLVRDSMHCEGDYRWRYHGPKGAFVTYEGHFFNNQLHGYGGISYDDGRVFNGIFYGNIRWGPGIESHACVKDDVGLWSGRQLIRLCWRPNGPSIAPDLMSSNVGRNVVKPHRKILSTCIKSVGEVNSALEMLKHFGAKPLTAVNKWSKLYPEHCTDMCSALCHTEMFEKEYYKGKIYTLKEDFEVPKETDREINISDATQNIGNFYSWNNNDIMKHMMMHCYKHEFQRKGSEIDMTSILSGPRKSFKPAGQHEIDSRTLLMASYLGHISQVTQLVNENNVHPDVADILGNTAIMYATCGDRADIIHFLVEAGANVNSYNDSCCTPLGVALINLACVRIDISPIDTLQALLPTYLASELPSPEIIVSEWVIMRESQPPSVGGTLAKSPSKSKNLSSKKIKSLISLKDQTGGKKKSEVPPPKVPEETSEESFTEDKRVYININREYCIRVDGIYQASSANPPVSYIFEVNDMIKEVESNEEDQKKLLDKIPKKVISKVIKEATKPSKDAMWQSAGDDTKSIDSVEKLKRERLARIMETVLQLLSDGANPKLVTCPQPALFIAIISGSSEAVRRLICYGADVNEVYPAILEYRPLDLAISQRFTYDNQEIIRVLLEHGAETQHRLVYNPANEVTTKILGPTLLHAVLARRTENEFEEEMRRGVLEMLLDYKSISTIQFKGRSAIDISMTRSMDIFDIFIKHPNTNLNSIINDLGHSVLLKMFYLPYFRTIGGMDRLQKITDLLSFGANPLLECQNGEETHGNLFVFAKKTLNEEGNQPKSASSAASKQDPKNKKTELKPKKEDKMSTKSLGRVTDELGEYRQALELVTDCARLLHVRWLQANIVKKLIVIIKKYSHRHWNMILKELKNKKYIGLWLTTHRCLDIWNILAKDKRKSYCDRHILKHLLNIVQFCTSRVMNSISLKKPLTAIEKAIIEKRISCEIHDNYSDSLNSESSWRRCYVKPELISEHATTFNVCFQCALPSSTDKIWCTYCKLVSFCSLECWKMNIDRANCHPCSQILKDKYFPNNSCNTGTVQDF